VLQNVMPYIIGVKVPNYNKIICEGLSFKSCSDLGF